MLNQIDLNRKMGKQERKGHMEKLEPQLSALQRELKAKGIPVMIIFEGYGASGKGYQISRLLKALDPRGIFVWTVAKETEEDRMHPFLWRFWNKTPATGKIAIFDRSWYRRVLLDRFDEVVSDEKIQRSYQEINAFERELQTGGTLVIKLFLCIDQKEQKKRFQKLMSEPETAWRVTKDDIRRNKNFDQLSLYIDETLEATDTDAAPWHLIEATDRDYASVKIYTTVINAMKQVIADKEVRDRAAAAEKAAREKAAKEAAAQNSGKNTESSISQAPAKRGRKPKAEKREEAAAAAAQTQQESTKTAAARDGVFRSSGLSKVDLTLSLTEKQYKKQLEELQDKIEKLHGELYMRRIPVVIGFEGWDAGGKGGAIKRLTEKMDPRGYRVNPTASPNDEERAHHYLWRFWRDMPKDGHIAIFDRTWYGRVMVERIEHFCTDTEWQRAYQEINEMERELYDHGAIVLKFWMQISKDEQERRFTERMNTPEKNWKITDEDWRNREKWDQYEEAVDEMLMRTSTTYAPWIIVEGNDKRYARVKVLRTVVDAIENRLKQEDR